MKTVFGLCDDSGGFLISFFLSLRPAYAHYHNKRVLTCRLADKRNLMTNSDDVKNGRVTLWLEIDVDDWARSEKTTMYRPGDHVGMFAANRESLVSAIIPHLQCDQHPDEPIELQLLKEKHTSTGKRY